MNVQAVIEICPQPNGDLPFELLRKAYSASQKGTIVFVLRDVTRTAIDHVLDDLVQELPLSIPGILYVDAKNDIAVGEAITAANMIFFNTDRFRASVQNLNQEHTLIQPVELALDLFNHDLFVDSFAAGA